MANTYTIQFRRGMYADFDTSKIRPGEPVTLMALPLAYVSKILAN